MRKTALRVLVAGCWAVGAAAVWAAAEDVGVYVDNPRIAKYMEAAEVLHQQLPGAVARWNAVAATGATFTVAFLPAADSRRVRQPCDGVPIHVTVEHSRVTSAVYAGAAAGCRAGTAVHRADDPELYALAAPTALFEQVASQIERAVQGKTCIDAYFDPDFGLPTTLNEGCPWLKNADLKIEVSDIVSMRQRFWNLAVTLFGGLLVLFGLSYYHYKKLRRRQATMPELMLR